MVVTGGSQGTGNVVVNKLIKLNAKVYSLDNKFLGIKKKRTL